MLDLTVVNSSSTYSDGRNYNVSITLAGRNGSLLIRDETIQGSAPNFASRPFVPNGQFSIGRATPDQDDGQWPGSFAGCLDGLLVNGVPVDLQDRLVSSRVSLEGCPAQVRSS